MVTSRASQLGLQVAFLVSFLLLCWLAMMAVHELGHVAAAYATGGSVARVVLHPLAISRTEFARNPRPLMVAWAGPLFGSIAPLAVWLLWRALRLAGASYLRFFAGFCLVANGVYLGVGAFAAMGDAGDILRHGGAVWQTALFGLATAPLGLGLWNGLGPAFGIGNDAHPVSFRVAVTSCLLLLMVVVLEALLSRRS